MLSWLYQKLHLISDSSSVDPLLFFLILLLLTYLKNTAACFPLLYKFKPSMSFGNIYFILTCFDLQDNFCFLSLFFVVYQFIPVTALTLDNYSPSNISVSHTKDYLGLAIISGVNFQSLSRKIKSHGDNCQECFSLLLEPFYDVAKWLLCPWL